MQSILDRYNGKFIHQILKIINHLFGGTAYFLASHAAFTRKIIAAMCLLIKLTRRHIHGYHNVTARSVASTFYRLHNHGKNLPCIFEIWGKATLVSHRCGQSSLF